MELLNELTKTLVSDRNNSFEDNYDYYRFGSKPLDSRPTPLSLRKRLRYWIKGGFINDSDPASLIRSSELFPYMERFEKLYDLLGDAESRSLMVQILSYRILGGAKVKLPLSTPAYWSGIEQIKAVADNDDSIPTDFMNWSLSRIRMKALGLPIEIYFTPKGAYTEFILRQYEYIRNEVSFSVENGDTVIDAGGCWGDTALLFAHQAGETGAVFSFEFLPKNISILKRNLDLNPVLASRITLVAHPVWEDTGKVVYYTDNGPGSSVGFDRTNEVTGTATTLSIDDLVIENGIERVDFIKMDIEGAEQKALKGARNTICKFRPKLAISLYHSLDDFVGVPEFIQSLNLGYTFYLGHFSIHAEETVLYAIPEKGCM